MIKIRVHKIKKIDRPTKVALVKCIPEATTYLQAFIGYKTGPQFMDHVDEHGNDYRTFHEKLWSIGINLYFWLIKIQW